jgi:hypothetical protein
MPFQKTGPHRLQPMPSQNVESTSPMVYLSRCAYSLLSRPKNLNSLSQGSDFVTVYVRHLDSPLIKGVDLKNDHGRLPEEIKFVKFSSITWTPDSKGFFYQVCFSMFRPFPAVLKLPSDTRTPPTLSK